MSAGNKLIEWSGFEIVHNALLHTKNWVKNYFECELFFLLANLRVSLSSIVIKQFELCKLTAKWSNKIKELHFRHIWSSWRKELKRKRITSSFINFKSYIWICWISIFVLYFTVFVTTCLLCHWSLRNKEYLYK